MQNKIVISENLGTVEYRKSHKAKRVSIRVKEDGSVLVAVPNGFSFEIAENFVRDKEKWILKSKQNLQARARKQTAYNLENVLNTKFRIMKLLPHDKKNMRLCISENYFEIFYPKDIDIEQEEIQAIIRKMIEHVWKVEAHEYLPERISEFAKLYQLNFKSLDIKNTRSFWGKCRGDNSIILSLHLMHLPDHLIDYVIKHELCHIKQKNHQKGFWQLLDTMTAGKAKILAKEMQNHSTRVY